MLMAHIKPLGNWKKRVVYSAWAQVRVPSVCRSPDHGLVCLRVLLYLPMYARETIYTGLLYCRIRMKKNGAYLACKGD